jgi:hypothetical protein
VLTLKRLSPYFVVFVILLSGFVATGLWHYLDYLLYRALYFDASGDNRLADNILLIDVPYRRNLSDNDPTEYRQRLADLLNAIAEDDKARPSAVILDIYIANDRRGLPELEDAIRRLTTRRGGSVDVYASLNAFESENKQATDVWNEHAQDLYRHVLKGYGHTALHLFMGVLSYAPELELSADGTTELLLALPVKVAADYLGQAYQPASGETVLAIGPEESVDGHTVAFTHAGTRTSGGRFVATRAEGAPAAAAGLDRKIVVIGSVAEDRFPGAPQAGPKLIAWALTDELQGHKRSRQPLNDAGILLGQVLFFALLTVGAFALLFQYVKPLQTRPVALACLAVAISSATLALAAKAVLSMNYVTPVGLTLFAIVVAGILAWQFTLKFLVSGVADSSGKYDAFISYSRQQSDWVVKNVYEPLKAMRKADGTPLNVFFDRTDIGLGETFTTKYMWAIVHSQFFIAIFSEDYYGRNHCRNEMDLAYKRLVEKKITILPIEVASGAVPPIYSTLNCMDARANPRFIEDIERALLGTGRSPHF